MMKRSSIGQASTREVQEIVSVVPSVASQNTSELSRMVL
jgi:hypothetical protein